jgi:hypothetical protein
MPNCEGGMMPATEIVNGCPFHTCKPVACPEIAFVGCSNGMKDQETTVNGCPHHQCVPQACPAYTPVACSKGQIVVPGKDGAGCPTFTCKTPQHSCAPWRGSELVCNMMVPKGCSRVHEPNEFGCATGCGRIVCPNGTAGKVPPEGFREGELGTGTGTGVSTSTDTKTGSAR